MDVIIGMDFAGQTELVTSAKLHLIRLISSVFNFAYYTGLCPVRFGLRENRVFRESWYIQTTYAVLQTILYPIITFARIKRGKRDWDMLEEKPSHAFNLVLLCNATIFWQTTLKHLWFDTNAYFQVLKTIQEEINFPVTTYWFSKKKVLYVWYVHLALKIVLSFGVGYGFVMTLSDWSPVWWFQCLVGEARYVFSFSMDYNYTIPELHEITFADGVLATLTGIGIMIDFCFFELADMLLLAHALSLWVAAKTLRKRVQEIPRDSQIPNDIFEEYLALERFSRAITKALGSQVFWYIAAGLPYYSIFLTQIVFSKDVALILRCLHTFIGNIAFFYATGKIGHEVELIQGRFSVCETRKFGETNIGINAYQWMSVRSGFIGIYSSHIFTVVVVVIFNRMGIVQFY